MPTDTSIIHLILNASLLVQFVMLILLLASLVSWTMIFGKRRALKIANKNADKFEKVFWSGKSMDKLYTSSKHSHRENSGMEAIFAAGYGEFQRLARNQNIAASAVLEAAQRAMRVSFNRETDLLEMHLSFLATVGSTSPYIGLFGTVWGIMHSFQALGMVQQATIAMVAPGISEALLATAMGLFAAIPAVIAYNRFVHDVDRLTGRYDIFLEELSALLHRHHHDNTGNDY